MVTCVNQVVSEKERDSSEEGFSLALYFWFNMKHAIPSLIADTWV